MSRRYRPYGNTYKSRSLGNLKAAINQNDKTNVILRSKVEVECGQYMQTIPTKLTDVDENTEETDIVVKNTGCGFINVWDVVRKSEYFKQLSGLYDQIKINSIKVDVVAIDWPTGSNDTNTVDNGFIYPKSLSVVTAWDRSGLGIDQIQFYQQVPGIGKPSYSDGPVTIEMDGDEFEYNNDDRKFYCTIGNSITSYSSSMIRHLGPSSSFRITRYIYPQSLAEKSQYIPIDTIKPQYADDSENRKIKNMFTIVFTDLKPT